MVEHRALTFPDYLVWGGWACTAGWVACSIITLHLQVDHPLIGEDMVTDSVYYLKVSGSSQEYTNHVLRGDEDDVS